VPYYTASLPAHTLSCRCAIAAKGELVAEHLDADVVDAHYVLHQLLLPPERSIATSHHAPLLVELNVTHVVDIEGDLDISRRQWPYIRGR
jgi:hypothetical protein